MSFGAAAVLHIALSVGELNALLGDPVIGALVPLGKIPEDLSAHDVGSETRAVLMLETLGVSCDSVPQVIKAVLSVDGFEEAMKVIDGIAADVGKSRAMDSAQVAEHQEP